MLLENTIGNYYLTKSLTNINSKTPASHAILCIGSNQNESEPLLAYSYFFSLLKNNTLIKKVEDKCLRQEYGSIWNMKQ